MEAYKKLMMMGLLLFFAISMMIDESNGQSICNMAANGLKSCLPSCVSGDNPVDPPYPACCAALAKADLKCFCRYKDSGLLGYYGIDPDKAMKLPAKCKVVTDPNWHC